MDDDSRGMRTGKRKERVQEVEEGYILGRRCRELPKNMPTSFRLAEVACSVRLQLLCTTYCTSREYNVHS